MLVKPPINPRNAVRKYVVLIALIPLQYIGHLFHSFPQISEAMAWQ